MRNILRIVKGDVKSLFTNTMSVIIAIGLAVLPSIFAWYNVLACWDVFDNTDNLKVAVANADEGYESDLIPLRINVGERVVSALRANDQMDWTFVTEDEAIDGVRSGRYYAAVVIPPEFSKDMLTFYSEDVQHAEILYYVNEKKNAISPKIIGQGADTVSYRINETFTETLSEISLGLVESLSRYADESDANGRIADVADHVRTMSEDVTRVASVLELYVSLVDASQGLIGDSVQLVGEAQEQIDGMGSAASQGASATVSAIDELKQSVEDLSGAFSAVGGTFEEVGNAVDGLFDAAASGSAEVVSQMRDQANSIDGKINGYRGVVESLEALRDQAPEEFHAAFDAVIVRANAVIEQMEGVRDGLLEAADKLESQDSDVQAQHQAIKDALSQAQSDAADLESEFNDTLRPTMERLVDEIVTFVDSVEAGLAGIRAAGEGLSDSAGSASELLGNVGTTLGETAQGLREAAAELETLADGIDRALATGDMEALRQVLGSNVQTLSKAIAAPVGLERIAVFPVANFGSAMAPLYTTIALFIGSLLILVAVKPTVSSRVRSALQNPKPRELFIGHFGVMALLSFAQTTLMGLGNMLFLQVQVTHPLLFMVCFWFAGIVFTFLIYAMVAAFANLGKALAVLLLIVQVTGCGGSFPLQILPSFVQAVSPWLPATHVVNAMRAAMFGVYQNDFWIEMGLLALFLIPAILIGLVLRKVFERFMKWYLEQVESSKVVG